MPKRNRNLWLHVTVTHEELASIRQRTAEVNSQNQSTFIHKMAMTNYGNSIQSSWNTLQS